VPAIDERLGGAEGRPEMRSRPSVPGGIDFRAGGGVEPGTSAGLGTVNPASTLARSPGESDSLPSLAIKYAPDFLP
jgi:hypothetical protein